MREFSLLLILSLLCLAPAIAQSPNATITGIVLDPSGAAIPGAQIIVVNDATSVLHEATTNNAGIYVVTNLPPGAYRIQVAKIGFKTLIRPDIILNVQDALAINFTLPVGATSEIVTVQGGAPLINTENAAVSTVVDRNFVENMPLNGRSFQDLILLAPGVVTASPQVLQNLGGQGEFSVNGQRTESNYYTVDGVSANLGIAAGSPGTPGVGGSLPVATALGTTQGLVSVDALQEFRVQTSTYSAEYGRNPGGQFSFVTRSGTNQWHGSAFDYLRNNFFDANDWFNDYYGLPPSAERQNDFGGTLGGPIRIPHVYNGKDKTFFFFSYEGLRLTQPQPASPSFVPDAYLRVCTPVSPLQQVLNAFPKPTASTGVPDCANPDPGNGQSQFIGTWSNPNSIDAVSARLDHVVSDKLRVFFRFSDTPSTRLIRSTVAASELFSSSYTTHTYTAGAAALLSSLVSNEFRLNYSSNSAVDSNVLDNFGGAQPVNLAQLQGIDTQAHPAYDVAIDLAFGGFPGLGQQRVAALQRQWNIVDAVSLSPGRHQLKFGGDYRRLAPTLEQLSPQATYLYFSAASVLANNANRAIVQANGSGYPFYTNFSAFGQDEWHITRRLTLSMGLRWEVNPAPGVTQGLKPYTVVGANNPGTMTLSAKGAPLWQTSWHDVAPRLGAAYILRNTPGFETIVRGGAGLFFDTGQQEGSQGFQGVGFSAYTFASGNLSFPVPALAVPPTIVNPPVPPYSNSTVYAFPPHLQLPFTLQTNLTIEQALGGSQALRISYVGAFGRKLLEQLSVIAGPANPDFSGTNVISFANGVTSDYNALQMQFQRRLSRGLQALVSYTWSHCFDYGSENTAYPYQRGNCDYDVRHNLTSALSYELPNAFRNRFARAAFHHWMVDDRLTARTSFPVILNGPCVIDPTTQLYQCLGLNVMPGQSLYVYGSQYPGGRAINANAFALPSGCVNVFFCPSPAGPGDAPRNFARGFDLVQMDMAIRREFPIRENLKLQFRAEAFNILNHPNFGEIESQFGNPLFGHAIHTLGTSSNILNPLYQIGGPRSMQFALKLIF